MKVVRLPTAAGGDWWIVTHDLTLAQARARHLRPIHVLTFLSHHIVKSDQARMYRMALALEDKLFAVRHHLGEFRSAVGSFGDVVYANTYVREYSEEQRIICPLEAMLGSTYMALEITARMNARLNRPLPQKFRAQSRNFGLFDFKKRPWLPRFFDVRSELTHFGSHMPVVSEGKILIEFTNPAKLEAFTQGFHEIELEELGSYATSLFDMLDEWAAAELKKMDAATTMDALEEVGAGKPLKPSKVAASAILGLL